jgi:hypothetical protein
MASEVSSNDSLNTDNTMTLSVYFNGSAAGLEHDTLANALHYATLTSATAKRMCFEGSVPWQEKKYGEKSFWAARCGFAFGLGLDEQCEEVVKRVQQYVTAGCRVIVNAYGHSRGAVACLLLAKQLAAFAQNVEVNLALSDPVPGNRRDAGKCDIAGITTLVGQARDLSECANLKRVYAIYMTDKGEGTFASFFAPLLPIYPTTCKIKEEIIMGAHDELSSVRSPYWPGEVVKGLSSAATIALISMSNFLEVCGTVLNSHYIGFKTETRSSHALLRAYSTNMNSKVPSEPLSLSREAHFHGACTVSIESNIDGTRYLNDTHRHLAEWASQESNVSSDSSIEEEYSGEEDFRPTIDSEKPNALQFNPPNFRTAEPEPTLNCQTQCTIC